MVGMWLRRRRWVSWTVGAVGVVAVGAVALAAVAAQEAQQRPTFRGGARFVRVDVYPVDRNGKPVEGLTAEDFEVFEDGKPQAIDTFEFVDIVPDVEEARVDPNSQREGEEAAKDPRARVFVVVLDQWHAEILSGARMRRPLIDMLDGLIGPRDLFGVTTAALRPSDLILGRKTVTVADMLQRYWTWGSLASITARDEITDEFEDCYGARGAGRGASLTDELLARKRERDMLEHLDGLVTKLGSIREEKKAVVVVTQGWRQFMPNEALVRKLPSPMPGIFVGGGRIRRTDPNRGSTAPPDASRCASEAAALLMLDNRRYFKDLLAKAQKANVSFYPVDPRGLAVFDTPLSQGGPGSVIDDFAALRSKRDGLMELADNTDGIALINNNDLSSTLRKFADSLNRYYLLGYYSTNTKFDGGYRRLEVKVRRPEIRLKARRGYFAPTQEEIEAMAAGRAAADRPVPAEALALSGALGRLEEVRHDRDLFIQASRVPGAVVVSAELGVGARQSPAWAKGGEVRIVISSGADQIAETRAIEPLRSGVVVRVPLAAAGGVRIDARARSSAGGGAADASATNEPRGESLLGDVLSYRGLARALMPAADGRYRRTERATIEAPLSERAIPTGARVLDRHGKPLNVPAASRERVDADGTHWIVAEVTLAPLTEGDYVIELEAMKDERRERKLFAIRVVR